MRIKSAAATAVLAAVAVAVTAGTANAAPSPAVPAQSAQPAPQASEVSYEVTKSGDAAVLNIFGGKIQQLDSQLVISDAADHQIAVLPLRVQIDDMAYPVAAQVDGSTATLTPSKVAGERVAAPVSQNQVIPVQQAAAQGGESFMPRDAQALGAFAQRAGVGTAVSAVLGAVLGAGTGCLMGAAVGATLTSPLIPLLVPFVGGAIAGCLVGMALMGPVGSIVGTVFAGGPIIAFSAFQYFSTILAPCPPQLAYCKDPATVPAPAAPAQPAAK
ncbi:hypothetical protein [Aldersonia kunmingensis]|uniref:hypothetical protein n=1 Tax=Aldersonia kunmingensis TaxID=408066 RepID=UPI00082E7797|nr:hypothetical protein [Aldersonia kunmingensis]